MVHLLYTAINFAAVMSAVRLKVQTRRAEWRSAVIVADKDVFQPEVSHPWLKTVLDAGAAPVRTSGRVFAAWPGRRRSLFLLRFLRLLQLPLPASRNVARICDDCVYEASVAHEDRYEKKVISDEYGNGGSGSTRDVRKLGGIEQIVNFENVISELIHAHNMRATYDRRGS
jgi:hypothetical protein